MAPKKATTASKAKAAPAHGSYEDMIKTALVQLKDRMGSSRQAIKKYVTANNNLGSADDAAVSRHVNAAIQSGVKKNVFEQPKGSSGPVKLAKKGAAPAAAAAPKAAPATKTKATTTTKTTTAKKPAAAKKAPAAKKTTTKTTTTKKAAAAPAATKTKANTAKPRKTVTKTTTAKAAPAVEEQKPVALGKTKSGRVTKSSKPQPVKKAIAPKKKAAPKKATPKAKA